MMMKKKKPKLTNAKEENKHAINNKTFCVMMSIITGNPMIEMTRGTSKNRNMEKIPSF